MVCFFVMGLIGVWFGVRFNEVNPGKYFVTAIGVWGAIYTILAQLRVNVTNLNSGSLYLSNFFAGIFHLAQGRVFWEVVTAVTAAVAMLAGVLDHVGPMLNFQGVFLFAWVALLTADLIVVKRILKIGPCHVEHRRGYLHDWNPVGLVSLLVSSVVGSLMAFGVFGEVWVTVAAFAAATIAFVLHVVMTIATQGKYYTSREPVGITSQELIEINHFSEHLVTCGHCHESFVTEDMLLCTSNKQYMCSQCCAEASCDSACQKQRNRYQEGIRLNKHSVKLFTGNNLT